MKNIVFDTNFYISLFVNKDENSIQNKTVKYLFENNINICISQYILKEIKNTLIGREHLINRYNYTEKSVQDYVEKLALICEIIVDLEAISVVRDPNDDLILATALKCKADYLVTRDKDLLVLSPYNMVQIKTPEDFIALIRAIK